ncbi:alkaline phosphatase [Pseudocolwellia sp. AS88]|uniref:alkaline phosphatase n=1 Tax=Pseudocolwellia sp. AS88 TaxID=3063958 RepID=UPI0026F009F2|nr:alkaline phosphatase [Pseudocolwellia sp. AS88]MDO7083473.1 alkaline phosphatase [Pseudocolwellia sp. AS88]
MNKILIALTIAGLTMSCGKETRTVVKEVQPAPVVSTPKNIIMIVGDGMGPTYTTAYRYFKDDPSTPRVENTVFDRHLVGMSSTYPDTHHNYVTDSAASATALSSAIKTYNGAVAVDMDKQNVETVLERARSLGMKTGVVVTSQINHATPASYLSHNDYRYNYDAIADSYIDNGIQADLYLGGGWKFFIREDRNLVEEFEDNGFNYIDSYQLLDSVSTDKPLLGLFGDKGLPWALDDTNKHRLSAMTKTATKHLENEDGYFLLVEGSQIDWAGHSNDIASAMGEMDDFAKTLEYLETYVKENPDTLVVITADHSTGGVTLGVDGVFQWDPKVLRTMTQSPQSIANKLENNDITKEFASSLFNFDLTNEEVTQLISVKNDTLKDIQVTAITDIEASEKISINKEIYKTVKFIINGRTFTGWTSSGHTAADVPVFAMGSNKDLFNGYQDNTDIAKKIFKLLGDK